MPKIAIVDTYYPNFIDSIPLYGDDYQSELKRVLVRGFGTADFYSKNLRRLGWEAIDIIANHRELQRLWCLENNVNLSNPIEIAEEQIRRFNPDVLFCQDLSFFPSGLLARMDIKVLAAQCSCPMPSVDNVKQFDIIFTSFPHYLARMHKMGAKHVVFNSLAFEPSILDSPKLHQTSLYDCVFIGGVGTPSHWKYGMEVLEAVAEEIPGMRFFGYGYDLLKNDNPIKRKYIGPAWGLEMYDIMRNSKVVLNRHGEVAENFANNMRMFEATGCGACLVTDTKTNLKEYFNIMEPNNDIVPYSCPEDAVSKIKSLLENEERRARIARNGQLKTLSTHTYLQRMGDISECLRAIL